MKRPSRKIRFSALTTRQLATLVGAGLPLERSLQVLAAQEPQPARRRILEQVTALLHSGHRFSEALAGLPHAFDPLFVNLALAGESSGTLPFLLERLADYQERNEKLHTRLITALVYPAAVLGLAVLVILFLLLWIVPQFQQLFAQALQGREIPAMTRAVMGASELVRAHAVELLVASGILLMGIIWLWRVWLREHLGKYLAHVPILGKTVQEITLAQFARTLGTLASNAVPLLSALEITRHTLAHQPLATTLTRVQEQVRQGESLGRALAGNGGFPLMLTSLVQVGEETGQLGALLLKASEGHEQHVETSLARLTSLIEPVLILLLGLVVAAIVLALFLPLVNVMQELSSG